MKDKNAVSLALVEYIDQYYAGNKSAFAASQGVKRQQVTKWVNGGFIVVDHVLHSPRRELRR